jgi:long-chain acyl-CoA synthetase
MEELQHWRVYAKKTPKKPALIMARNGETFTYRVYDERVNQIAQFLLSFEEPPVVTIVMENNNRILEIICGCIVACVRCSPGAYHLAPSEIEYVINDFGANCIITSYAQKEQAAKFLEKLPNIKNRFMVHGTISGYDSFEDNISRYPMTAPSEGPEGREILYSSGTTGWPKAIVNIQAPQPFGRMTPFALRLYRESIGLNENTVYLNPGPLYHAAPLRSSLNSLRLGGTLVVMDHFDAEEYLAYVDKYKITHSQVVPTMFIRMLKLPEKVRKKYDLSSLKCIVHAAAPCPIPVKEQMIEWLGPILLEYYSSAENNSFTLINSHEWLTHKGSVGKSRFGKLHVMDKDSETELPLGEPGTIYVEGGANFEYHNDPRKTLSTRNSKGWTTIGDMGYLDDDGYLYLTDRKEDMIISGGVNIYPQEAEKVLVTHPKVADAAVFGIPNLDLGEEVKAVIQPMNMADTGLELEKELIAFCQQHLSKLKCPRSIDFEKELPRLPTGKLLKRRLKERYWGKDGSAVTGITKGE